MENASDTTQDQGDRRHAHRKRVLKGGIIFRSEHDSEQHCRIRNMHEHGAELDVSLDTQLPREFLLYVAVDGVAYQCSLIWRNGKRAGVNIHGTQPKPAHHY